MPDPYVHLSPPVCLKLESRRLLPVTSQCKRPVTLGGLDRSTLAIDEPQIGTTSKITLRHVVFWKAAHSLPLLSYTAKYLPLQDQHKT